MGRTVPSFRMLLEEINAELSVFRRALRGEDKDAFTLWIHRGTAGRDYEKEEDADEPVCVLKCPLFSPDFKYRMPHDKEHCTT